MKKNRKTFEDQILFVFQVILKLIIWVLGAIIIYWLLLKITGHSPVSETVFMGVFGIIGAFMAIIIRFMLNINREIGDIKRFMKESDRRFYAFAGDYRKHLREMH